MIRKLLYTAAGIAVALVGAAHGIAADAPPTFASVVVKVQPMLVKIHGAGGLEGLESYQSGFLISGKGHVLTVWSYVLDSDTVKVTLDDGRRFDAQVIGADPRLEIAVLKIEAEDLPHFDLKQAATAGTGQRVLAFSNLFGVATGNEPASVQRGIVAAKTSLSARSGAYQSPYRGDVYVLDAVTNNPGAAGGALANARGELLGLLGKELRSALNNTWLNYAIPAGVLTPAVDDILAGKTASATASQRRKAERPLTLGSLGIVLVPDVLDRTPPFIDLVRSDSPAAAAGLQADDLIIFLNDQLAQSCKRLHEELQYFEFDTTIKLTVMRGQELIEATLQAPPEE